MSAPAFTIDAAARRAACNPQDPRVYGNPYEFYTALHATCPTFWWEEYGMWCFTGFDDVNALLRDKRFGRAPGLPERTERIANWWETERYSLLALDPPDHTEMRALVNRAFLSRQIERLRPRIAALATELIDGFAPDGHVDLLPRYAAPLPAIVIAEMIGLPRESAPELLAWSNEMVRMYMFGKDEAVEASADRAAAEFVDFVRGIVAERRRVPTEDLLTHMLHAEIDGERLSETEVIATTILLLNAGHEATVHTTGNAVKVILEYCDGLETQPTDLVASDEQIEATVEECLRFDAPLHMFTRFALDDIELANGMTFAAGEQIGLMLGAANRDPNKFSNPDEFDPFRTDGANVSFGAGIHFCIGAPLARLELQTSLSLLLHRFPTLRRTGDASYRNILHFHGLDQLPLSW
ncbi:MAG TPA: cytochrome P450 [Ilumatobacter sp.]|nr:cytochrome P450 [Ilumatobacter sp.]